jgi:uncharacterized protein (TIGR02145 family)
MRKAFFLCLFLALSFCATAQSTTLRLKVFLQGAYVGNGTMNNLLNAGNRLPLAQPYNTPIWNYDGSETLGAIPAQMVDWVLVDLRTAPDTAIARKALVLYTDGSVRDILGNEEISFNAPQGNYYVAVMHRSHLSVMTSTKISPTPAGLIDFTDTSATPVYGRCIFQLAGGAEGMIAGDINHDKIIKYSGAGNDRVLIINRIMSVLGGGAINSIINGYYKEDLRMDGNVKYSGSQNDPSLIIQNLIGLTGSSAITSTFTGAVPHAVFHPLPLQPSPIMGPTNPCQNETGLIYSIMEVAGLIYTWTVPSGWIITAGQGTNQITLTAGVNPGIMLVTPANNVGQGPAQTLALSPQACGTGGYPPGYVHCDSANPTAVVNVTNPVTGKTWMDRNLGATSPATSSSDTNAYGDLFQWGRFADGHQCRTSSTTTILSSTDQPGHPNFIRGSDDWRSQPNDNLWQGVDGINNPCPEGYRIPTAAELDAERLSWSSNNGAGALASPLKWSQGGYRYFSTGSLDITGNGGYYWSSTINGFNGRYLEFFSSNSYTTSTLRAYGLSVRCILDEAPPCTPQPDQANAGPDSFNIPGDSIVLQANTPVNGIGQWSVISGLGGVVGDSSSASSLFTGIPGTTYSLVWTISTNCGSNSDTVNIGFADIPVLICPDSITDNRDGQVYPVVQIGNQCWMGKNLNYGLRVDSELLGYSHSVQSNNMVPEKYCYNNDDALCTIYGGLYEWGEAMDYQTIPGNRGLCPEGWRVPTDQEWDILTNFLGGASVAGGKLKDTGLTYWNSPNTGATNITGFSARGAAYRMYNGSFNNLKNYTYFHSSNDTNGMAITRTLYAFNEIIHRNINDKNNGLSVRCLQNFTPGCAPQPDQANAGPDQLQVQGTSVQLAANQPVNGSGHWRVYSGQDGSFADSTLNNSLFTGNAGETYQLAWIIQNSCGYTSDLVTISFAAQAVFSQCGDTLIDARDGQQYPTTQIGEQCWMAKNLNIGTSLNGSNDQVNNGIIEKYCYNDDVNHCSIYGGLYQWDEMMNYDTSPGSQGICPTGWHIPTDAEWCTVTTFLDPTVDCNAWGGSGTDAGGKMKATGFDHWYSPNTGATNSSGFTALAAGNRYNYGGFDNLMNSAIFWSSSEYLSSDGIGRRMDYDYAAVIRDDSGYGKGHGFSVRCLSDSLLPCTPQPDQANAGPDSFNIPGTSLQLQANVPTAGNGTWSIVNGAGGSFADSTNANTLFSGLSGNSYILSWTITTACGSSSDSVEISFAPAVPYSCGDTLTDIREGQQYPTIQIGNQCWMAKNLNVGTMVIDHNTGSMHSHSSNNGIIEKYCFNNDPSNCTTYGGLYDWNETMEYSIVEGGRGICPEGWHIPTDAEWSELTDFLGGLAVAGGKLKENGYLHWNTPNSGATNESGFSAIGGGWRNFDGVFYNINVDGYYWASTEYSLDAAWYRQFTSLSAQVVRDHMGYKTDGISVRCLANNFVPCTPQPDQANAGPDSFNIPGTSIVLQANTPSAGSGQWTIINGQGGILADSTSPTTSFTGLTGQAYTLSWTITTTCGSSTDSVDISFAPVASLCSASLTDTRDGQVYAVVEIGGRCWMGRNLNYGVMATSIYTGVEHKDVSNDGVIEKYCHNNDSLQCAIFGGLYDWNEAMTYRNTPGIQGACPEGWHIPMDSEWQTMVNAAGGPMIAGGNLKETGIAHWLSPNVGATDNFGFTALPGSARYGDGVFSLPYSQGLFWSSTDTLSGTPSVYLMNYDDPQVGYIALTVNNGLSVRCIMDTATACSPLPDAANAGPDRFDIPGFSTNLQGNQAVTGNGVWQILSGVGGILADSSLATSLFTGQANEYYELSWTISNACGYSADKVILSFAGTSSFASCGSILTDTRDGQQYPTVLIGNQCWMASNLNTGTFVASVNTGSEHSDVGNNGVIEKYCYDNDANNCLVYGGLYDWNEAMDYVTTPGVQGICPTGWHIPTDAEWKILEGTVDSYFGAGNAEWENGGWRGLDVGGNLKESSTTYWISPNTGATNNSGFSALPNGLRNHSGGFNEIGSEATWWTSSENDIWNTWSRFIHTNLNKSFRFFPTKTSAYAVRCLIDSLPPCTPSPDQADAGPDSLDISGISFQLEAIQPTGGTGAWSVVSGSGGIFTDRTHYNTVFSGQPGETYQLAWTITNSCGNTRDFVTISFLPPPPLVCGDTLVDNRDGQSYPTVQIGTQCWMAKNLNVGNFVYSNADWYAHSDMYDDMIIEKYCHNNNDSNCLIYGGLYEWNEAMGYDTTPGAQGICPDGWHIPTAEEWDLLSLFLGGDWVAGGLMKDTGTALWTTPNQDATNSSGFTAIPGGNRDANGYFGNLGNNTTFWVSKQYDPNSAWYRDIGYIAGILVNSYHAKEFGFSVRCLSNTTGPCAPQPDQANAGPDTFNITGNSITLQANTPMNGSGQWSILSGQGGSFDDDSQPNATFTGNSGETYVLVWTVSTACGSSTDTLNLSFAAPAFNCGDALTDVRDSQVYPTVQVGTQCWMAANLNIGSQVVSSIGQSNNGSAEKYCYQNNATNCDIYGGLYEWNEAMNYSSSEGAQGLCPAGWHLPTDAEWSTMEAFLGGVSVAGGKLKEMGTSHWLSPNTNASNSSGMTMLPGGYEYNSSFGNLGNRSYIWTSTSNDSVTSWMRSQYFSSPTSGRNTGNRGSGFSVRCIMD